MNNSPPTIELLVYKTRQGHYRVRLDGIGVRKVIGQDGGYSSIADALEATARFIRSRDVAPVAVPEPIGDEYGCP